MNARVLDVLSAIASFLVIAILLVTLPYIMNPGIAYLLALIGFILVMSYAGFKITDTIT